MTRALLAVALLAACHSHGSPKNVKPPEAGVAIAVYERDGAGFSVIDDRRFIELGTQTSILLANIDPGADLASLVLEPTNPALHVGSCTRDRLPEWDAVDNLEAYSKKQQEIQLMLERERRIRAIRGEAAPPPAPAPHVITPDSGIRYAPVVRCEVSGAPGKYLVRLLYVSTTLRYRAQHDIELAADGTKASVVSRFALPTPIWRTRAEVTLFDGVPGGTHPPEQVTHGMVELDGTVAILAVPPKSVQSEMRRVFDGAILAGDEKDPMWGHDSTATVVVWLELAALKLAPGPVHVHLEGTEGPQDLDVPPTSRKQSDDAGAPLRLPLWVDDALRPTRVRTVEYDDGHELTERLVFTIGNTSDTPRDVYIEEHLRPAQQRKVEHPWPKTAKTTSAKTGPTTPNASSSDILRTKLEAKPGKVTRTGYTLTYVY